LVKNQRTPEESSPLVLHQRTAGTSLRSEPIGGNDTAWYRYRRPGDDLHPHLDGSWSHNLADDLVIAHARLRERAGLPALREDSELTASAGNAAWHIARSSGCEIYHSSTSSRMNSAGFYYVGENLYKVIGMEPTGGGIADAWYAEMKDYRYGTVGESCTKGCLGRANPPCQTGHFTQMMWADSTSIGCAMEKCSDASDTFVAVCQYGPGGNIVGELPFDSHTASRLSLGTTQCSEQSFASSGIPNAAGGATAVVPYVLLAVVFVLIGIWFLTRKTDPPSEQLP